MSTAIDGLRKWWSCRRDDCGGIARRIRWTRSPRRGGTERTPESIAGGINGVGIGNDGMAGGGLFWNTDCCTDLDSIRHLGSIHSWEPTSESVTRTQEMANWWWLAKRETRRHQIRSWFFDRSFDTPTSQSSALHAWRSISRCWLRPGIPRTNCELVMAPRRAVRSTPITRWRNRRQLAVAAVGDVDERLLESILEVAADSAVELFRQGLIGATDRRMPDGSPIAQAIHRSAVIAGSIPGGSVGAVTELVA